MQFSTKNPAARAGFTFTLKDTRRQLPTSILCDYRSLIEPVEAVVDSDPCRIFLHPRGSRKRVCERRVELIDDQT
jgi:hypothetical protein